MATFDCVCCIEGADSTIRVREQKGLHARAQSTPDGEHEVKQYCNTNLAVLPS